MAAANLRQNPGLPFTTRMSARGRWMFLVAAAFGVLPTGLSAKTLPNFVAVEKFSYEETPAGTNGVNVFYSRSAILLYEDGKRRNWTFLEGFFGYDLADPAQRTAYEASILVARAKNGRLLGGAVARAYGYQLTKIPGGAGAFEVSPPKTRSAYAEAVARLRSPRALLESFPSRQGHEAVRRYFAGLRRFQTPGALTTVERAFRLMVDARDGRLDRSAAKRALRRLNLPGYAGRNYFQLLNAADLNLADAIAVCIQAIGKDRLIPAATPAQPHRPILVAPPSPL